MADTGMEMNKVEGTSRVTHVEPPTEIFQARVDDKGRLKLPADIQRYLNEVFVLEGSVPKVFITSLDRRTVRIYPTSVWKQNELLLEQDADSSEDAEYIVFMAKDLGGTSEVDSQGRILVPAALRRLLNLENEPVWLNCYKSRINMLGREVYEEMQAKYMENTLGRLRQFERKGLK